MTTGYIFMGFDPGLSGGMATVDGAGFASTQPIPVAGGEIDIATITDDLASVALAGDIIAVVEAVHSMPKQGVASTFKFGKGYGKILGMLEALKIRTMLVTPQAWKAVILAGTPKDKDAAVAWCRGDRREIVGGVALAMRRRFDIFQRVRAVG